MYRGFCALPPSDTSRFREPTHEGASWFGRDAAIAQFVLSRQGCFTLAFLFEELGHPFDDVVRTLLACKQPAW